MGRKAKAYQPSDETMRLAVQRTDALIVELTAQGLDMSDRWHQPKELRRRVLCDMLHPGLDENYYYEHYTTPCARDEPYIDTLEFASFEAGDSRSDREDAAKRDIVLQRQYQRAFKGEPSKPSFPHYVRMIQLCDQLYWDLLNVESRAIKNMAGDVHTRDGQRKMRARFGKLMASGAQEGTAESMVHYYVSELTGGTDAASLKFACNDEGSLLEDYRSIMVRLSTITKPTIKSTPAQKHYEREAIAKSHIAASIRAARANINEMGVSFLWDGINFHAASDSHKEIGDAQAVDPTLTWNMANRAVAFPLDRDRRFRELQLASAITRARLQVSVSAVARSTMPRGNGLRRAIYMASLGIKRDVSRARNLAWRYKYKPVALGGFSAYTVRPGAGPQEDEPE